MNAGSADDEMGIRGTPGNNLVYSNRHSIRWEGSGIIDKPISDFFPTPSYTSLYSSFSRFDFNSKAPAPYFGNVQMNIHPRVIPEPAEYALVFALASLAFVIVRRRFPPSLRTRGHEQRGDYILPAVPD